MPPTLPWKCQDAVTKMILELRANRLLLAGLTDRYSVFLFTGGAVSRDRWNLAAIGSYLDSRFAADRVSSDDVERYRQLAQTIMELGQTVAGGGPKPLRLRHDIAETFGRASIEIARLGSTLETSLTQAIATPERPPVPVELAAAPAEIGLAAMDRIGTPSGGDQ